jgi:hypothetical protein
VVQKAAAKDRAAWPLMRVEYAVMGVVLLLAILVVLTIIVLAHLSPGGGSPEQTALVTLLGALFAGFLSYVHTLNSRPG